MKPYFLLLPLLFLCFSITLVHADLKLINSTCKAIADENPSNIHYGFCMSAFTSSKAKKTATLRGLGSISINLVKRNVTSSRQLISRLIKNKKIDIYVKHCLIDCFDLYHDAGHSVKEAMKFYKSKKLDVANVRMSSVMDSATTCEDGFDERPGVVSPIKKTNSDTFQLSAISLSIMHLVQTGSKH